MYSPYAKVLVKTKTTPKNTIFELLYLNHHNIPPIENLVANTQLILEQLGISVYWILVVLKPEEMLKDFWRAKTAKQSIFPYKFHFPGGLGASKIFGCLSWVQYNQYSVYGDPKLF